jgi:uncharacterized membrane protein
LLDCVLTVRRWQETDNSTNVSSMATDISVEKTAPSLLNVGNTAVIAGSAIGGLIFVIALVALIVCFVCRKKQQPAADRQSVAMQSM